MLNPVNYALYSIHELVEMVRLQEQMIKEQEEMIAMLKEALKLQEGPCQN